MDTNEVVKWLLYLMFVEESYDYIVVDSRAEGSTSALA